MDGTLVTAKTDGAAEVETILQRIVEQIAELREQMKADDVEIAKIKAETATLKTEGISLKTEGVALKTETQAIIASWN